MLRVTGEAVKITENPYDIQDESTGQRNVGISRKVRVETSRGEYVDVKVPEQVTALIPQDGDAVDWQVGVRNGRGQALPQVYLIGAYRAVMRTGELVGAGK